MFFDYLGNYLLTIDKKCSEPSTWAYTNTVKLGNKELLGHPKIVS